MLVKFSTFSERLVRVLKFAQVHCRRKNLDYITMDTLMMGIMYENWGAGSFVLKKKDMTIPPGVRAFPADELSETLADKDARMLDMDITPYAKRALIRATQISKSYKHNWVGTEHLLIALAEDDTHNLDFWWDEGNITRHEIIEEVQNMIQNNPRYRERILDKRDKKFMKNLNLERGPVSGWTKWKIDTEEDKPKPLRPIIARNRIWQSPRGYSMEDYIINLSEKAEKRTAVKAFGRETEITKIIQTLMRRRKNNSLLVGEPGVGKTHIATALAIEIAEGNVPERLASKEVIEVDLTALVAGTKYRGEFEERIKIIIQECKRTGEIILVIDEIHQLIGAGGGEGAMDAANIVKPALSRSELQVIGATTVSEYKRYIEKDLALARRFQIIKILEPNFEDCFTIISSLKNYYEYHHNVTLMNDAINSAIKLSSQYVGDRFLPDKAIDLIDEAAAKSRLIKTTYPPYIQDAQDEIDEVYETKMNAVENEEWDKADQYALVEREAKDALEWLTLRFREVQLTRNCKVTPSIVQEVISEWTGIPLKTLSEDEKDRLLNLEQILHQRVIGQNKAVTAVTQAVRRARVGLKNPNRPIANFLFCGPTGVGKTELAKALADSFFGNEDAMLRLDMSEYMEKHTVAKLIGSPAGYVGYEDGGILTEAIKAKPYTLLLLDEIEKGHLDIYNILLQVLDDGRLTDSKGNIVDFTNTIIIMTSNIGSQQIQEYQEKTKKEEKENTSLMYRQSDQTEDDLKREKIAEKEKLDDVLTGIVKTELQKYFRPELLNRIDHLVVFNQLTYDEVQQIADLMLNSLQKRLLEQGLMFDYDSAVLETVAKKGYDPIYGARPLRRVITEDIENIISNKVLEDPHDHKKFELCVGVFFHDKNWLFIFQPDVDAEVIKNTTYEYFLFWDSIPQENHRRSEYGYKQVMWLREKIKEKAVLRVALFNLSLQPYTVGRIRRELKKREIEAKREPRWTFLEKYLYFFEHRYSFLLNDDEFDELREHIRQKYGMSPRPLKHVFPDDEYKAFIMQQIDNPLFNPDAVRYDEQKVAENATLEKCSLELEGDDIYDVARYHMAEQKYYKHINTDIHKGLTFDYDERKYNPFVSYK